LHLEQHFRVPAPIDKAWETLLDVQGLVACVPGAALTEVVSTSKWKGRLDVSLGAIHLTFDGFVEVKRADVETRTILMWTEGQETRGKGVAQGTVTSHLWEEEGETVASVTAFLQMSGQIAQFSRGLIDDIAGDYVNQFATNLAARIGRAG
jgi:carbon monoxide dehydrogenase subunit G